MSNSASPLNVVHNPVLPQLAGSLPTGVGAATTKGVVTETTREKSTFSREDVTDSTKGQTTRMVLITKELAEDWMDDQSATDVTASVTLPATAMQTPRALELNHKTIRPITTKTLALQSWMIVGFLQ